MKKLLNILALFAAVCSLCLRAEPPEIEVTIGELNGKALRPLHGLCNWAPFTGNVDPTIDLVPYIQKLQAPYSYFHDAELLDPGLAIMDVSRVFPLFHADPDDPRNYLFEEGDLYFKRVVESGTKIIFRLGESIECHNPKMRVRPPKDFEKWADICIHIIRHYNEGWANGYHWGIQDWAIWEEPNNPNLWGGEFSRYLELYAVASRKLKAAFPHLNIGGPETTTMGLKYFQEFAEYCAKNKLPLDFACFTAYFPTPEELLEGANIRRKILDDNGFKNVPLWINEWHMCPNWDNWAHYAEHFEEVKRIGGVEGGVFVAATLAAMQDSVIDRACFYCVICQNGWGLFDMNRERPAPAYYALDFFGEMYRENNARRAVAIAPAVKNAYGIAGEGKDGTVRVLLGFYNNDMLTLKIALPKGLHLKQLHAIDKCGRIDQPLRPNEMTLTDNGRLTFRKATGPAAYMLVLEK